MVVRGPCLHQLRLVTAPEVGPAAAPGEERVPGKERPCLLVKKGDATGCVTGGPQDSQRPLPIMYLPLLLVAEGDKLHLAHSLGNLQRHGGKLIHQARQAADLIRRCLDLKSPLVPDKGGAHNVIEVGVCQDAADGAQTFLLDESGQLLRRADRAEARVDDDRLERVVPYEVGVLKDLIDGKCLEV